STTAAAYRNLFSVRAAEHAEFTTAMTERLAEAHISQRELEGLVTQQETRAQRAESRLTEAQVRVQTLEESIVALRGGDDVADLVAWDEQTAQSVAAKNVARDATQQRPLKQA
ncbi:MAG: hypothetical protein JWQ67_126, partial [Marmoricola sp.]|nr:hypothetical protein [Marmoricola sp.]